MGCDIHAYVDYDEFKTVDGWHVAQFAKDIDLGRNYALFALLAGVRYSPERHPTITPGEPKGEPPRWAYMTKHEYDRWEMDAHSLSWMTVAELEEIQRKYAAIEDFASSWDQPVTQAVPVGAQVVTPTRPGWMYVGSGERTLNGPYQPLDAVIAAMRSLDGDQPGRSRLVFWFDN